METRDCALPVAAYRSFSRRRGRPQPLRLSLKGSGIYSLSSQRYALHHDAFSAPCKYLCNTTLIGLPFIAGVQRLKPARSNRSASTPQAHAPTRHFDLGHLLRFAAWHPLAQDLVHGKSTRARWNPLGFKHRFGQPFAQTGLPESGS